ncbi:MAG: DUF2255 family protein [Actinobacteria bacterium]|nr:DUF2255 family protein [Actinomycetota bacterium]
MATWPQEELERIGATDEIGIASRRADGSVRPYVTIWVVRSGDELYVRSAYGADNPWYRRALASGQGRIRAGDSEFDVAFTPAGPETGDDLDAVYHAKYDRFGQQYVGPVTGPAVHGLAVRLEPLASSGR